MIHIKDSISESRIDSAYMAITNNCDSLLQIKSDTMAIAIIKGDSNWQKFMDTSLYIDADKKVEKVIQQLKADCDTNLLRETYKKVQHRKTTK